MIHTDVHPGGREYRPHSEASHIQYTSKQVDIFTCSTHVLLISWSSISYKKTTRITKLSLLQYRLIISLDLIVELRSVSYLGFLAKFVNKEINMNIIQLIVSGVVTIGILMLTLPIDISDVPSRSTLVLVTNFNLIIF